MKIIYLHQYFNTPQDVGGTRSYEMARRLVAYGHRVEMITTRRGSSVSFKGWRQTEESGIRVHWLHVPYSNSMSYPQRMVAFLRFAFKAALKASSLDGDIVFATSTPLTIALPAIYAAKCQKIPMVFEVRDLWPEIPIAADALKGGLPIVAARWLEQFAYKNSEHIIALSPGMKEGIHKTGYPAKRITIIPNSADLDLFNVPDSVGKAFRDQFDWLKSRPLVVYTGTMGLINGVDYLARLAASMRDIYPEVRFLIIGKGKKEGYVREVADQLGVLNQNLFMMEPIPKEEITKVLSAADIATSLFIDLPEMWSNSANKFFDALASGTPIVINYQGWQAELLQEMNSGLALDVQDVQGSAQKLSNLLRNKKWLKQASKTARRLAEERFSREILAQKLQSTLEQVLQEKVA